MVLYIVCVYIGLPCTHIAEVHSVRGFIGPVVMYTNIIIEWPLVLNGASIFIVLLYTYIVRLRALALCVSSSSSLFIQVCLRYTWSVLREALTSSRSLLLGSAAAAGGNARWPCPSKSDTISLLELLRISIEQSCFTLYYSIYVIKCICLIVIYVS